LTRPTAHFTFGRGFCCSAFSDHACATKPKKIDTVIGRRLEACPVEVVPQEPSATRLGPIFATVISPHRAPLTRQSLGLDHAAECCWRTWRTSTLTGSLSPRAADKRPLCRQGRYAWSSGTAIAWTWFPRIALCAIFTTLSAETCRPSNGLVENVRQDLALRRGKSAPYFWLSRSRWWLPGRPDLVDVRIPRTFFGISSSHAPNPSTYRIPPVAGRSRTGVRPARSSVPNAWANPWRRYRRRRDGSRRVPYGG